MVLTLQQKRWQTITLAMKESEVLLVVENGGTLWARSIISLHPWGLYYILDYRKGT